MRSKISRGSPNNGTECIVKLVSGGVDEDCCRSECPAFACKRSTGSRNQIPTVDLSITPANRRPNLPVPHAQRLCSAASQEPIFVP